MNKKELAAKAHAEAAEKAELEQIEKKRKDLRLDVSSKILASLVDRLRIDANDGLDEHMADHLVDVSLTMAEKLIGKVHE